MEKTEARKRLDVYIDICLDCEGIPTPERNCGICPTAKKVVETVQEIRAERKK